MSVASFRGPPRAQAGSVAERVGFEPTVRFPPHTLSKRAPSATRTPLRGKRVLGLTESAAMIDRPWGGVNATSGEFPGPPRVMTRLFGCRQGHIRRPDSQAAVRFHW